MDFSKNSLRMRLHNIRPFIVPITEFIDIPVVAEISDLPAGCVVCFSCHPPLDWNVLRAYVRL